jgi:hypothetical protein
MSASITRDRRKAEQAALICTIGREIQHRFTYHAIFDELLRLKKSGLRTGIMPERHDIHDALNRSNEFMKSRCNDSGWSYMTFIHKSLVPDTDQEND